MRKIVFFPGWPRVEDLLDPFIKKMREDFIVEIYNNKAEGDVFISYSAGVIDLLKNLKEEQVVMIAPAGLRNRSLIKHCFSFLRELLRTSPRIIFKVWKETAKRILRHPLRSWREIEKIRRYKLEMRGSIFVGEKDLFMKPSKKIDSFQFKGGHFYIMEDPENLAKEVKRVI